ncbi:MAG: helix-turn-helix domain-containing protein [Candidatus Paceibacterota bacterium]|jgi:transcriptional regulator with XRE-family HTH domain
MSFDNETKMAFVLQRAQGKSFAKIADDLGVSKQTLIKWQGDLDNQIREQEYFEIQNITESFAVTRRQRFGVTAKLLGAVLAELTRRADTEQLAEMTTDKLVNLALTLERRLNQDTGRELISVRTGRMFEDIEGTFIEAD